MTSKLTREWLQHQISAIEAVGISDSNTLAAFKLALSAMGSEPVAWRVSFTQIGHESNNFTKTYWDEEEKDRWVKLHELCGFKVDIEPLYRHAQQPVVPATLPCSVELKPGLIIGKGCKTETLLTALRRRADYNADIDAMTPEERAEHDASIKAFKAMLASAQHDTPALNSLQSVDSVAGKWIPVSERMPESNGVYFGWDGKRVLEVNCFFGGFSANQFIHGEITHWMPLPAAPQEVPDGK